MADELINFISSFKSLEFNFGKRIIALENKAIPPDYGNVIALQHQEIIKLQNKLEHYELLFKNISSRIDAQGAALDSLKAGMDAVLAQIKPVPSSKSFLKRFLIP